jgi:hypothetical protein
MGDFELESTELASVTNISFKAATRIVGFCYGELGEFDLGWCVDKVDHAKRRLMI